MKEIVVSPTLIRRLATARSAAVLTGAGISAESGVPTFRDEGGLWQRFRPEELANVDAFLANPVLVQAWYRHRLEVVTETQPNPGHEALSMLEEMIEDFTIITQNVDNLHRRAGGQNVLELHGNIARSYCIDCEASVADLPAVLEEEAARCDACGGLIRPDVVWFGEMLPEDQLRRAMHIASEPEQGTTVTLRLPRVHESQLLALEYPHDRVTYSETKD